MMNLRQRFPPWTWAGSEHRLPPQAGRRRADMSPTNRTSPAWEKPGWPATLTTLGVMAVVLLFRRPEQLLRPQFWAEDGIIYFWQAWRWGGGRALLEPYAGYHHLIPRLLAWLADTLPVLWRPAIYNWGALGVTLGVGALICRYCRLDLRAETRVGLALALVLVPHGGEVFLTQAALQWLLAPLLLLLIVQRPAVSRGQLWADALLFAVAGLTGPMLLLLLPLFGCRFALHGRPRRAEVPLFLAVVGAVAVQGWTVWHSDRFLVPAPSRDPHAWLKAVGFVAPGRLFFGDQLPELLGGAFWLLTPVLVAGMVWLWRRVGTSPRWLAFACVTGAVLFYAASIRIFADRPEALQPLGSGTRYFFMPYVLTAWTLLILREQATGPGRRVAEVLLGLGLLAAATHFTWLRQPDFHWPQIARSLARGERTIVRHPGPDPKGWRFEVEPRGGP